MAFVVTPFLLFIGAAFIPFGLWMHRRQAARAAVLVINISPLATKDGKQSIAASNCTSCHTILAQRNGAQFKKPGHFQTLESGHTFFYFDPVHLDFSYAECQRRSVPTDLFRHLTAGRDSESRRQRN